MADGADKSSLKSLKIEPEVHAWLLLLSEKYNTTLSGAIRKLVAENEPEIIELQNRLEKIKREALGNS
jgi:hypothetical protein